MKKGAFGLIMRHVKNLAHFNFGGIRGFLNPYDGAK